MDNEEHPRLPKPIFEVRVVTLRAALVAVDVPRARNSANDLRCLQLIRSPIEAILGPLRVFHFTLKDVVRATATPPRDARKRLREQNIS